MSNTPAERLKVLIVDDSVVDAELLLLQLRRDAFDPQWERVAGAEGLKSALARIEW